jgi:predicted amidohydrolase YtcJ
MKFQFVLILCISICQATVSFTQQKADLIIVNGKITILDENNTEAEAVAIAGNKILSTGTNQQVLRLMSHTATIIDANGKRVIPGLFDSHLHVIRAGRFFNTELRWDGVSSLKKALGILKEQAQRTPAGQWVRVVGGWTEYQFAERRLPSLEEINEATGDIPAFILYLYGKAWVNKAGLKKLNINSGSPSPPGGLIEKDDEGNPTGLLIAEPNAFILYSTLARLPELSTEEKFNSTIQFMRELNSLGVTGVMDAGGGFQNYPDDYHITDSLHRAGKLTIRLPYFLFAQKKGTELGDYNKWIAMAGIDDPGGNLINEVDYHIGGGGENLVSDAADFENFLCPRPELPASMESNLEAVIRLLVKKRWPFRLHATYDESISRDLDVIEKVNREIPLNGLTWFIDHAETITERNLLRIKKLGGGIAIQHRMAYQGESFVHRYGKQAASSAPPVKRMLQIGIPVGLGTDGTRVAGYNPWIALYWITTGKTVGGTQVMSEDNTLDRVTALRSITHRGYELIKEKKKGKIGKGYYADLVILDKDYFSVTDDEVKTIRAKLTIVDGKIVYGRDEYSSLAPLQPLVVPGWSPVIYYGGSQ